MGLNVYDRASTSNTKRLHNRMATLLSGRNTPQKPPLLPCLVVTYHRVWRQSERKYEDRAGSRAASRCNDCKKAKSRCACLDPSPAKYHNHGRAKRQYLYSGTEDSLGCRKESTFSQRQGAKNCPLTDVGPNMPFCSFAYGESYVELTVDNVLFSYRHRKTTINPSRDAPSPLISRLKGPPDPTFSS